MRKVKVEFAIVYSNEWRCWIPVFRFEFVSVETDSQSATGQSVQTDCQKPS